MVMLLVVSLGAGYAAGKSGSVASTTISVSTSTATTTVRPAKYASVTITAIPDLELGSDNQTHDAFTPSNFTVYVGQTVNLTLVNYDDMPHSFTSPSLGVNFMIPPASSDGVPSVSHYQFTVTKAGDYRFWCATPCDSWAMAVDQKDGQIGRLGYMGGYVHVASA